MNRKTALGNLIAAGLALGVALAANAEAETMSKCYLTPAMCDAALAEPNTPDGAYCSDVVLYMPGTGPLYN